MTTQVALTLGEVVSEPVDWRLKSFPVGARAISIGEVAEQGWNAIGGDFSLPVLVLKERALDHNVALIASYCARYGVSLAPHAKTPVSPQIINRQLAAGAWGISVATFHQARLFRHLGAGRILMANQLLDEAALAWVAQELEENPEFEFWCLIDSADGIALMESHLARSQFGGRLRVLIELGVPGGRRGGRTRAEAVALAEMLARTTHLQLAGVGAYEGMVHGADLPERIRAVDALIADMRSLVVDLDHVGLPAETGELIVTAGGSMFFDRVVAGLAGNWNLKTPVRTVLRSGAYVAHDGDEYEKFSALAGRAESHERLDQAPFAVGPRPFRAPNQSSRCSDSASATSLTIVGCRLHLRFARAGGMRRSRRETLKCSRSTTSTPGQGAL